MNHEQLTSTLKQLRLYAIAKEYIPVAQKAEKEALSYEQYLSHLIQIEQESKKNLRVQRYLREAQVPYFKSIEHYNFSIRKGISKKELKRLMTGEFLKEAHNVVFYGDIGVGKTHLAVLLVQKLCELGYRCYYSSTHALINQLLEAKRDLQLNTWMKKLDRYDLIVCDELGFIPHSQDGADLFFQLISARTERKSLLITTNLTYSEWDKVFINPLTTAAAVDRIIYHCHTFNIEGPSFRSMAAKKRTEALTQSRTLAM